MLARDTEGTAVCESSLGLESTSGQSPGLPYLELHRNVGLTPSHPSEKMEPTQQFTKTHEGKTKRETRLALESWDESNRLCKAGRRAAVRRRRLGPGLDRAAAWWRPGPGLAST